MTGVAALGLREASLLVMADDLTGACDVGAVFARAGLVAAVVLRGEAPAGTLRVVNTQSRQLSPAKAAAAVRRVLSKVAFPSLVFKKIDTALRGHLGAEIGALLDALPGSVALVAPAIPEVGRYTRGGRQWAGARSVVEAFAADRASRVQESSVATVLARETGYQATVIGLDLVREGRLSDHIADAIAGGRRIVIADAETDSDLAVSVGGVLCQERPVILVGSTGLARAAARRLLGGGRSRRGSWLYDGPALVLAGSANGVTKEQSRAAADAGVARRMVVDPAVSHRALIERGRREIASGKSIILEPPPLSVRPNLSVRRRVEGVLAYVALEIAAVAKPARVILVGGESAYRLLSRAGARYLVIDREWAPLVVNSTIYGGKLSGLPLLSKGGSTGAESCLSELLAEHGANSGGVPCSGRRQSEGLCAYRS